MELSPASWVGFLLGTTKDRRDPRVRVLAVVDGVLVRLLARELEVEVDRRVVRALEEEEARGVDADVVEQVVERDELALALRHPRALAALHQVDELHDQELQRSVGAAERAPDREHALDVPVVVGAPDVDEAIEPALALVLVVG